MATVVGCATCGTRGLGSTNVATIEYLLQIFCSNAQKKGTWPPGLNDALVKLRKAIHAELMNIVSSPYGMTDAEINGATELLSLTATKGNIPAICAAYTGFEISSVISRNHSGNTAVKTALNEVAKALSQKAEVKEVIKEGKKQEDKKQDKLPPSPPSTTPAKATPWGAIIGAGVVAVGAWLALKD